MSAGEGRRRSPALILGRQLVVRGAALNPHSEDTRVLPDLADEVTVVEENQSTVLACPPPFPADK
jgi:hypothetical protein